MEGAGRADARLSPANAARPDVASFAYRRAPFSKLGQYLGGGEIGSRSTAGSGLGAGVYLRFEGAGTYHRAAGDID